MTRFLQILLALIAARLVWKRVRGLLNRPENPHATSADRAEKRGRVVGCERCDLHVPEERAVFRNGRTFCSEACAAANPEE